MKKLMTFMFVIGALSFQGVNAQETNTDAETPFNQWSIDINAGLQKPTEPFAENYFTPLFNFWNADIGVRYMFNEKFGVKLDGGYYSLENGESSLPFKTKYYRTSLQGVVNAGNILGFRDWTDRINLLVHGGFGYSYIEYQEPIDELAEDHLGNIIIGLTPQIRLSDKIALNGDISVIGNGRHNRSWDGTRGIDGLDRRGIESIMFTGSIGISIYLGGNEKHADWYDSEQDDSRLDSLQQRLAKLEQDLIDTDQDGVADYLDREPNTVSGVAVDTKGVAVDQNENNVPDELEESLNELYSRVDNVEERTTAGNTIKRLIDEGYVNVYFDFNSAEPATYSLQAINYLIKYLHENPTAEGEIIGFADEIGEPAYNEELSERRAKQVYQILLAAGIEADRLSYRGGGEDPSVDKSSSAARQLVRRVTFRLTE